MHKVAERPIELRRVTFSDATPTDSLTMNTREALWYVASTTISTATADTSLEQDPMGHESSSMATTATPATNDEPASPVLPRKSDRLSSTLPDCSLRTPVNRQTTTKQLNCYGVGEKLNSHQPYVGPC